MDDRKELDRKNFLLWLALSSPLEILRAKEEYKEKYDRMFKEYIEAAGIMEGSGC